MFAVLSNPHQKSTGTSYTATVALLAAAFVFSPAILVMSRPSGYLPLTFAFACSLCCTALAWVNWKRASTLTIPSLEVQRTAQ